MTALVLPIVPAACNMGIAIVSAKNDLTPAFGGAEQELSRKGTRYALTFRLPPMTYLQSMEWDDLLAEGDTVVMRVFQPGLIIPAAGVPKVNGAGQAGRTLNIDGLPAGYAIRKGQFVSVISDGQRYLYRTRSHSVANSSGQAALALRFMLRRPPNDNDEVEIVAPKIEGAVRGLNEWEVGVDRLVALEFTVRERD